jgi:hypothetical protein
MKSCKKHTAEICLLAASLIVASSTSLIIVPTHAQKATLASQTFGKSLTVFLTIYGINSTTGQLDTFAKARDMVKFASFNSTKVELQQNRTDGTVVIPFIFQNLTLKTGEPFSTCVVVLKDVKMICNTDYKTPSARPQYVDILVS